MSDDIASSFENVNEFFRRGHEQQVSLSERHKIIQTVTRRTSAGPGSIAFSSKKRAPALVDFPIAEKERRRSSRIGKRQQQQMSEVRGCFVNDRTRLTSRVAVSKGVGKPKMKVGIFNHFQKSSTLKLKTFDEKDLLQAENKPIEPEKSVNCCEEMQVVAQPVEQVHFLNLEEELNLNLQEVASFSKRPRPQPIAEDTSDSEATTDLLEFMELLMLLEADEDLSSFLNPSSSSLFSSTDSSFSSAGDPSCPTSVLI